MNGLVLILSQESWAAWFLAKLVSQIQSINKEWLYKRERDKKNSQHTNNLTFISQLNKYISKFALKISRKNQDSKPMIKEEDLILWHQ